MSQTRPHAQQNDFDAQRSTRKHQPSQAGLPSEYPLGLTARQRSVLQLQRTMGNAAVQRLLAAPNSPTLQRQDLPGLEPLHPEPAEAPVPPAPTTSGGGEERLTSQEWLAKVKDSTVILSNPMIGFSIGDTFSGFPAKVESFDFSAGGEAQ
jgi:hypothetical protein